MSVFSAELIKLAEEILSTAREKNMKIATAESCTGGLISALLTEISGSSDVFERGFITYSNESKEDLLGVDVEVMKKYGAVSEETAAEMAEGVLDAAPVDIALSVTGIAGPGGGSKEKPVGLVYIGIATTDGTLQTIKNNFSGDRSAIRMQAVKKALMELLAEIKSV